MIWKLRTTLAMLGMVCCALTSIPNHAKAQTTEALAAADRLIAVQDVDAMMQDMASKVAASLPGASDVQKRAFVVEMNAPAFMSRYKGLLRIAMARNMTVDELNAMSEFYSRPVAKSAMTKMGTLMADVMPFIQSEIPAMVARVMKTP
ncbi:MAG: DUF2059 domain-containing protein [Solirubrobacteraceae bacterium]|nr:DUF2059 domain-containing protein [Solirubrobacteraceae bacterium]